MSDINYSVYGDPTQWTHWQNATPQSGTQGTLWGQQRIGASLWTDSDFDDYPYFMFGKDTIYRNYKNIGSIDINTPLDSSIAYSAMANPELPQQNTMVFDRFHSTLSDPVAYTEKTDPTPFALSWYYYGTGHIMNPAQHGDIYGLDGFPDNASVFGAQGMQRVSPYAMWDSTYTNTWGMYNPNLRIAPVVSFGIKSVILEIIVTYDTNGGYYPTEKSSLKTYLAHSESWLQSHKLIAACCIPYYRTNKDGTYTAVNAATATDRFGGCSTLFFRPYKLQGIDIYNYTAYLSSDLNISGNLPIYGNPIADGSYTAKDTYGYYSYNTPTQTDMNSYAVLFGTNKGDLVKTVSSGSIACHMELDMSIAENVEYIMRGAAAYGLFFCTEIGTLGDSGRDTDRWVDNNMYLGIIRSDGMTYGEYTKGLDNAEQPQYGWKSSTETPYVPGQNTNIYSQQTRIKSIGHIETMTKRYVLDENAVQAMAVDMFAIMSDLSEQGTNWSELQAKSVDAFLVQNPIDCIVSLKKYPVKSIPKEGTLVNIRYGRYTSGSAAAYECTADVYTYAFTPREIQPRFGNSFLDYEPYTSAELFIPYCGTVQLRMCDILGKTLQPFVCVDYHTGQCTGFVLCDGIVIETVQGTIAVDVPVTGIQTATVEGQLQNAANVARQARVNQFAQYAKAGLIVGAATLINPAMGAAALATQIKGTMNTWMQTNQADYDLTHTEAPQHIIGTSSSACGWIIDADTARLILYYPGGGVIDDDTPPNFDAAALADFIAFNGVATGETGQIRSHPGVMSGCKPMLTGITTNNGIAATAEELSLIEDAIFEGLIVPVLT